MALSKVGAAAAVAGYSLSVGATVVVTFTADTTFAEGDVLVGILSSGAMSAGSTYTAILSDNNVTFPASWQYILDATAPNGIGWEWEQNTFYAAPFYHTVTSGEAGGATVTCTITLASNSSVGVGTGYIICSGGIAVRGGTMPTTGVNIWVPVDNSDADNTYNLGGASPQTGTFNGPLDGYSDGAAGQLLLHWHNMGNIKDKTGSSRVWTGPTELTDYFLQNAIETGATDVDVSMGLAYELIGATADWPSGESVLHTWTGGANPNSGYAVRMGFGFGDLVTNPPPQSPDAEFPYDRRRVSSKALPFNLNTGLLNRGP